MTPSPGARKAALHRYAAHPWYKKIYSRLSREQLAYCDAWIDERDHLDIHAFEMAVNRMYLDMREKPFNDKARAIMQELISSANSAVFVK